MLLRPSAAQNDIVLSNGITKQPFTYEDTCVESAPHVGYDPVGDAYVPFTYFTAAIVLITRLRS